MCLRIAAFGCGCHIVLRRESIISLRRHSLQSYQIFRGLKREAKRIIRSPGKDHKQAISTAQITEASKKEDRWGSLQNSTAISSEDLNATSQEDDRITKETEGSNQEEEWDFFKSSSPKKVDRQDTDNSLFKPVELPSSTPASDFDIGEELTGNKLKKASLLKVLSEFYNRSKTQILAAEHGLDSNLYRTAFDGFRRYCVKEDHLPVEFHIVLSDILAGAGHLDDIFPYFLQHAKRMYPHLDCIEELRKISDLTEPVHWYPTARNMTRKIIYHAGPTNSGKTYHALKRFVSSKCGVYCGPLRMLAVEVFNKCNETETPCDLVTGEDRRQADPDSPAEHVACTVEMTDITKSYEVAVIDEIQMLRDQTRGWAWTRALLGLCADEVHLCGEGSALDMVRALTELCGDKFEVRGYDRLTSLTILDDAVESLKKIRPGDCIVCFRKMDIYSITQQLEALGHQCAVIYGGLPPGTKYAQAERFNDPADPCNVLVATDAIGMGLNLAIKRVIFFSLSVVVTNKEGVKEKERISTSQALQIAGRAGRYGTQYEKGEVTTFHRQDLPVLKEVLAGHVNPIEQVGLHPTADQIELFAYHLPKATLSNLIDIFVHLCKVDHQNYFMCNMDDFKFLANMIEHIPLPLKVRYVFCCAPISSQEGFVCNMFLKFARQFSTGLPVTFDWVMEAMKAPFNPPRTLADLMHLEQAFDVFDLYLWLGYRFAYMFPDMEFVRDAQSELDYVIQGSVAAITALLKGQVPNLKPAVIISSTKQYGRRSERRKNEQEHAKADAKADAKNDDHIDEAKDSDTVSSLTESIEQVGDDSVIDKKQWVEKSESEISDLKGTDIVYERLRSADTGGSESYRMQASVDKNDNYENIQEKREQENIDDVAREIASGAKELLNESKPNHTAGYQKQTSEDNIHVQSIESAISGANTRGVPIADSRRHSVQEKPRGRTSRGLSESLMKAQTAIQMKEKMRSNVKIGRLQTEDSGRHSVKEILRRRRLGSLSESPMTAQTERELAEKISKGVPFGRGQLTKAILKSGLITEEILAKLHEEWETDSQQNKNDSNIKPKKKKNTQ